MSTALDASGGAADALYRESIEHLAKTPLRVELARSQLLYGEWLRREGSTGDARDQLAVAHDALNELAAIDPQQSRIVELRFFGGLSIEETAEVLEVSHATVERDWKMARAWLRKAVTS